MLLDLPRLRALTISTQGDDHGQKGKENRSQGSEESQGRPHAAEGAREMNYTLTQAIDRTRDLSGILKAARAHEADCAADHEAKKNIAEIAGEAHNKAVAACLALEQEREELADHVAALVRKTGEPLEVEFVDAQRIDSGPNATVEELLRDKGVFWTGAQDADLQAQALQNGLDRIGEIVDEATGR